ncbi:MAG: flagellar M-ring protein FliF C-terminal domain-containing protein, partial [Phyllobacterium sp.]
QEVARITQLVSTAAGLDTGRGDIINVTAVNFLETADEQLQPVATPVSEMVLRQAGTLINAAALIGAVALVLWFGVRPLKREMNRPQTELQLAQEQASAMPGLAPAANLPILAAAAVEQSAPYDDLSELRRRMRVPAQNRLEQMIDMDEERVAAILKQWVHEAA